MKLKALIPFTLALATLVATAQETDKKQDKKTDAAAMPKFERGTATAKFDVGTMTIEYGIPTWNDKFKDAVRPEAFWRMGNNDPTTCTLDCGLNSANGPVTPGNYKLGIKYVKDGLAHLVIYQGATFYAKGLPTWEIPSESVKSDAPLKTKLELSFEGTKLNVAFGPYAAVFALKPIKAHAPINTEFADAVTDVRVLALPLGDGPIKDLNVGMVQVTRGEMTTSWNMMLTIEGENAKLAFKNVDAATIAKDKETMGDIVKRLAEFSEKADAAQKEHLVMFQGHFNQQLEKLAAKEKALERLQSDKTLETKTTKRTAPTSTLEFSHDRPTGSITFKFGAKDADASFEIKPREFTQRPKR